MDGPLDALARGGVVGGLVALVALLAFWWLAASLDAARRWQRSLLACWAAYGMAAASAAVNAYSFELVTHADEAMFGALVVGAAVLLPSFLLLLLIPSRKA